MRKIIKTRVFMSCIYYYYRYLGYVDKIGTAYESDSIASGYGAYIAQVRYCSILVTLSILASSS